MNTTENTTTNTDTKLPTLEDLFYRINIYSPEEREGVVVSPCENWDDLVFSDMPAWPYIDVGFMKRDLRYEVKYRYVIDKNKGCWLGDGETGRLHPVSSDVLLQAAKDAHTGGLHTLLMDRLGIPYDSKGTVV